jgi:flagellar basal-body rod protein FlgB
MSAFDVKILKNFIDYTATRNQVISKNIANIGTENYRREDVNFNDILAGSNAPLKVTNSKHFSPEAPAGNPEIIKDNNKEAVSGINNVNIDEEMAELAKNTLQYKFASQKISRHFKTLQNVIKGGGGI